MLNSNNYCITEKQANTKYYRNALKEELSIGANVTIDSISKNKINQPEVLKYKAKVLGNKNNYTNYADWVDFIIKKYGPRERCLSLGSGLGRIEKYFVEKGFTSRIETIELCSDVNEKTRLNDNKISVNKGDLNFTTLQEGAYDFIICHGVLHHLINLEHILEQINNSLNDNGLLMIYEYVGPDRWQFSDKTMSVLKENFPHLKFNKKPKQEFIGFESIRSSNLLPILEKYFGDNKNESVIYGGIYFPFLICAKNYNEEDLVKAIEMDEKLSCENSIEPCYHMGIYYKTRNNMQKAVPWNNYILKQKLPYRINKIIYRKILSFIRSFSIGILFITFIKKILNRK